MWISGVDFPEELLAAARSGTLVIFVGAGASKEAPANLPDFAGLTKDIVAEAALTSDLDGSGSLDTLLGMVEDAGVDVHARVHARIDLPGSAPNALHAAIVALAAASKKPRIVTTNYDGHLSAAARNMGFAWAEYMAPALPMGDDFEGVVYLHGSLSQDARNLIATDSDFGRAYMRDAWAARFLERMFASFTVAFVGYSHGDVVMRYLARSLGPRAARYVLTSNPGARGWQQLGIRPIGYEVKDTSHRALTDAIDGLAHHLAMGLLEHQQRLAQILAAPPSDIPEEASYLAEVLGDDTTAGIFTGLARGDAWLKWAAAQPRCVPLFARDAPWASSSGCWPAGSPTSGPGTKRSRRQG